MKINLLDTPGFNMFVHEAKMVLPVVDAALVVVDGVAGLRWLRSASGIIATILSCLG